MLALIEDEVLANHWVIPVYLSRGSSLHTQIAIVSHPLQEFGVHFIDLSPEDNPQELMSALPGVEPRAIVVCLGIGALTLARRALGQRMTRYIAKRLIQGVITMWLVTLLVFGMLRITGNPVDFLAPPDMPHQGRTYLKKVYGLDEPAWKQYLLFNKGIFTGDFGRSFSGTQQPALEVFWARFPATMQFAGAALLFSIVAGVGIGVVSATRPESIFDRVGKIVAITGQAMPVYWLGLLLILLFVVYLRWLPTGGGLDRLGPKGLILPSFALGWAFVAAHTRIVRSSMLEVLESDYIKMVRA